MGQHLEIDWQQFCTGRVLVIKSAGQTTSSTLPVFFSQSVKRLFSHPKLNLQVVAHISAGEGFLSAQCFVVTVELGRNCDR